MDPAIFDDLQTSLTKEGPTAAIDKLCARLEERKDYSNLFYALLLKRRHELGVSPVPTGPAQDLPAEVHEPYEDAIRQAGRKVGRLYLDQGDIPHAWVYFRMLGEPQAVTEALEAVRPGEGDDVQPLVEIAFHEGVHPRKGFDLILERFGLCNAITTASGQHMVMAPDVREHCIRRLVRALYDELRERLAAEVERREGSAPAGAGVRQLLAGRDWLFEDEFAHIDVSHLSAVVQLSIYLPPGPELEMARELCEYGRHLSPRFQYPGDPPFEDQYRDYGLYLDALAGHDTEAALAHFQAKADNANVDEEGTRSAEVLVNLLLRLDRPADALAVARRHLKDADNRQLTCPSVSELCQRAGDYQALTEIAREQSDPVHFMAGLLAARQAAK